MRLIKLPALIALALTSAQKCDRAKAWIHIDGTKSFSSFISDRAAYVQNISEGLAKTFTTFSYGFSIFGDRLPDIDGPQQTCFYPGVENPATTSSVSNFLSTFTEVDDGKDAAESSIDTSMFLLAHKWAPATEKELRILIIITDAVGKKIAETISPH